MQRSKLASYVGFAVKSGSVIFGEGAIGKHARRCKVVLLTEGASEKFAAREFQKIYIIYTDMKNSLVAEPVQFRLLPFHRNQFAAEYLPASGAKFEFAPSVEKVLNNIIPGYVSGFIYSALVDSFCSEQNARMTAMDSASRNADKMLKELTTHYNRVRQSAITQEITEIAAGEKAQKAKRAKENSDI